MSNYRSGKFDRIGDIMRDEILARMPDRVIEEFLCVEEQCSIEFEKHYEKPDAGCMIVDASTAIVMVKDPSSLKPASFLHEILHLRRYYVEGIPQLISNIRPNFASKTENNLEHIYVVPWQRELGFDDDEFWKDTSTNAWNSVETADNLSGLNREISLIQRWFDSQFSYDEEITERANSILKKDGMHERVEELWVRTNALITNKTALTKCYLEGLGLNIHEFALRHLNDSIESFS